MSISDSTIEQELTQDNVAWFKKNKEKIDIWEVIKDFFNKIKTWEKKIKILTPIAIITTCIMIAVFVKTYLDVTALNKRSIELINIKNYDTNSLNDSLTKADVEKLSDLSELIDYNWNLSNKITVYNNFLNSTQAPYENFTKYILLPNLNIWKNIYLWTLDTNLIWSKYVENDKYSDIYLIEKWWDFIKDVWTNEYNTVNSISIGSITEEDSKFYIPISITFTANSKRSFLLLIEKLSTTSNQKNISLINEFIHNIRESIKVSKIDTVKEIANQYELQEDRAIWYHLYTWIFEWWDNLLIDENIINEAIGKSAQCTDWLDSYCYYKFRDKYRNIPQLAYSIWLESNAEEKTENFKEFFATLPPIIKITNFTYDKTTQQDLTNYETPQYQWNIEFRVYWAWIMDDEITEIQQKLWTECLWKDLTPTEAITQIDNKLVELWNATNIDTYSTINLMELKKIISEMDNEFNNLWNYKKAIRTFEIYRMLKEWNVCNLK